MLGILWEQCNDGYGEYPSGAVTDPTGVTDYRHVLRGGDWRCGPLFCRSAHRFEIAPIYRGDVFRGFQAALSAGVD